MYDSYCIDNYEFNYELNKYIELNLVDIFFNILPNEIIKNIVENMDLNYQWVKIRKEFNLKNTPLNLDFNLQNYKYICKKFLSNLTIAFVYQDYQQGYISGLPDIYFLSTPKEFDLLKKNDNEYLDKFVDIIYYLNNSSISNYFSSINFYIEQYDEDIFKKKIIKDIKNERKRKIREDYYESFIKDVIKNKYWRCTIKINNGWHNRKELVEGYQKYHNPKEDQEHMNNHRILFNTPKCISAFHACTCWGLGDCIKGQLFNKYENEIKFKVFIEVITIFCVDFEGSIGVIIDNKFAVCSTWGGGFTIVDINHLNGSVKISELTDFTNFHITPIIELLKDYGDIILQ
jgi:hypothetical protein